MYQGDFVSFPSPQPVEVAPAVSIVDLGGNPLGGFDGSRPATATITTPALTTTSAVLLAANPARRQFKVYNPTNVQAILAYAASAGTSAAPVITDIVPAGGSFTSDLNGYTGVVTVIATKAPGAGPTLHVTEITT